jgi:hypothetical protein
MGIQKNIMPLTSFLQSFGGNSEKRRREIIVHTFN